MTTVTATASCLRCDWTAGPGDWTEVDKQAEKHAKTGHPVMTSAMPATTMTTTGGQRP